MGFCPWEWSPPRPHSSASWSRKHFLLLLPRWARPRSSVSSNYLCSQAHTMCTPLLDLRLAVMAHKQEWNQKGAWARHPEGAVGLTGAERKSCGAVVFFWQERDSTLLPITVLSIKFYWTGFVWKGHRSRKAILSLTNPCLAPLRFLHIKKQAHSAAKPGGLLSRNGITHKFLISQVVVLVPIHQKDVFSIHRLPQAPLLIYHSKSIWLSKESK